MNCSSIKSRSATFNNNKSMHVFGESFIDALPTHLEHLKIPGRTLFGALRREHLLAQVEKAAEIQSAMYEVLCHPITQEAQTYAENTFKAFIKKNKTDAGVLSFFNGWNETHKTTSLVSAKIIMRLSADALSVPTESCAGYHKSMAHMYEVTKDDFGLGHKGHDGMYNYMATALGARGWVDSQYSVRECDEFSAFLYDVGVAEHKSPMYAIEYKQSIMDAMMVAVSSELWNGREYNFLAQYIEAKLLSFNPSLSRNVNGLRSAKGYVFGHAGEVENKHGLHALAAVQAYSGAVGLQFEIDRLKKVMLDYNKRIGKAYSALHAALTSTN
ncbi:hypothetical protein SAMN04487857_111168 [Pseudomonas sp. ok272]|uniref:hypothetical protein n=1 Tax=unclassified Pseudomonas TaxID=196821 RepID=UPI0008C42F0C|nr:MULTISPECIES: hypothetical protein [unclassified Pseudomonas]SEN20155.1 hypothetical protein SAMN04487857_111168 [Pseudomonas sp. ok272]SFN12192.1 hypothetical protein SAMN04487858_112168 [Pseudomonas sp. ok602]